MRVVAHHEALAAARGVAIVSALPDDLPPLDVDADRIVQALGNLVGNALKFTPHGGVVRVGVEQRTGEIRFVVADTGPGIPAEDAPHIFDRFWAMRRGARSQGMGLGLAIVRGIAQAHGGRAALEPAPHGAKFVLTIPMPAHAND